MRISIITPASAGSRSGNRNTATRWAKLLRGAGHRVVVEEHWGGARCDVMIALHARRSHPSIVRYASIGNPLVVALTGTDVYRDIHQDPQARESLVLAARLIVLQEMAVCELPRKLRDKARVVHQSARAIQPPTPLASCFEIVVSGHLREEKDPFRTAAALSLLPRESGIRVTHIGRALNEDFHAQALEWTAREPRYRWLGELPHSRALRVLARSRVMVISSRMEGGANVVSEALTSGVPVIASRISGNMGMLGRDYPGYYPVGNERALAKLLDRVECDPGFYESLDRACRARARLFTPERERAALTAVIAELTLPE